MALIFQTSYDIANNKMCNIHLFVLFVKQFQLSGHTDSVKSQVASQTKNIFSYNQLFSKHFFTDGMQRCHSEEFLVTLIKL